MSMLRGLSALILKKHADYTEYSKHGDTMGDIIIKIKSNLSINSVCGKEKHIKDNNSLW